MPGTLSATTVTPMPTPRTPQYLSVEERRAQGKRARERAPLEHRNVATGLRSPDPVATLTEQDETRDPTWCRYATAG